MKEIIICDDESIYGLITENDNLELYRSHLDRGWTKPQSRCVQISDPGNNMDIRLEDKKLIRLPYHTFCELFILMTEYFKLDKDKKVSYVKYRKII